MLHRLRIWIERRCLPQATAWRRAPVLLSFAVLLLLLGFTLAAQFARAQGSGFAEPPLEKARALAEKGRATQAEPLVREYLKANPKSAEGHFLLGYVFFREIQEKAASSANEDAGSATASVTEGMGHTSISSDEKKAGAADMEFRTAKAKASLDEYTEGAKHGTPSAADLKIVALDYVLLDDYSDADKWLTKMLSWTPDDAEGWYFLGRTKYNENRFEEAVQAFKHALKLDVQNVKATDNLGLSYAGLGRTEEAIAAYEEAIAWQKNAPAKNPGPFIDMGSLLLDQNRSAEAIPYLLQALEISPRDSKAHELLGKAHSRLEQFQQARVELEKAEELSPQNANLPCMLGPVYRKLGLAEKAKLEFDRCAALNGTHSSPETPRP